MAGRYTRPASSAESPGEIATVRWASTPVWWPPGVVSLRSTSTDGSLPTKASMQVDDASLLGSTHVLAALVVLVSELRLSSHAPSRSQAWQLSALYPGSCEVTCSLSTDTSVALPDGFSTRNGPEPRWMPTVTSRLQSVVVG